MGGSIEDYEELSVVGKGNFGVVFLVRRRSDGARLVLKQLHHALEEDDDALVQVNREVQTMQSLSHENVVKLVEAFVQPGQLPCLVCEYCEGGTLNDQLRERRRQKRALSEGQAMELFAQLALALDHMHHHRVIHRDLKPENVLVSREGLLKVGDFGLSRQLSSAHGGASTRCGTPFYMAPEIVYAEPSGRAADIWALGVILYELLTMRRPFEGENLVQLAINIARADYPKLLDTRCSAEVRLLVSERLLVVNQHERAKIGDVLCSEPVGRALATHLERVGDDFAAEISGGGGGGGGGGRRLPDAWTAGLLLPLTRRRTVYAPRMMHGGGMEAGVGEKQPDKPAAAATATAVAVVDEDEEHRGSGGGGGCGGGGGAAETLSVVELARTLKSIIGSEDYTSATAGRSSTGREEQRYESEVVRAARARKNTVSVVNRVIAGACFSDSDMSRMGHATEKRKHQKHGDVDGRKSSSPRSIGAGIGRLMMNGKGKKQMRKMTTKNADTAASTGIAGDVLGGGGYEGHGTDGRGGVGVGVGGGVAGGMMSVVIEDEEGELEAVMDDTDDGEGLRSSLGLRDWVLRFDNDEHSDDSGSEFDF